ncbi:hypothetical protein [Agrococcus sp. BE272]|uniref:hypothetical protein n=1 Tax=Agrococcus sp. BE272 TaxID=2817727 RepID=UPI00286114E0|nr:hypothetical protein [Agrococcus sp. BE272]MDR7234330.1 hypothetical protein [Agrococcus sp. BE272]
MTASLLLVSLGLVGGLVMLLLLRASPRATVVAWTLALFFVPIWVGASVGFFWAAITLLTLAAIVASISDVRLRAVDGAVAGFALLVVALHALQLATLSATVIALLQWVVPYVWGRLVLERVGADFMTRTLAAVATAAAVLALVEFATGTNAFVLIPGSGPVAEWSPLQPRGAFLRAEGAFGHSIALGASLAMACSCVIASRWRAPVVLLALVAVVGAIVVTFSRIGLITAAITIALSLVALPGIRRGVRAGIVGGGALAVALLVPFLDAVFVEAGDEAGGSAEYRSGLLALVPEIQLLGSAGDWTNRVVEGAYLGTYSQSVDNTLLLIALRFGWVPTALVALAFAGVVVTVLRGRGNPAAIAVVAQLPALFAVALITQYGMLLWFLLGLAVSWPAREPDAREHAADRDLSAALRPTRLPGVGAAPSVA